MAIPLLVLALPFLDTFLAVGRRMRSGAGIMTADKQHLHHRLLEIGHSHRRAVLILYAWSALLAGSVVALSFTGPAASSPSSWSWSPAGSSACCRRGCAALVP